MWRAARDRLRRAGIAGAEREARLLAEDAFGYIRDEYPRLENEPVSAALLLRYHSAIARRLNREPVARILGHWDFYGLTFDLGPDTLVPRPETELLVDFGREVVTSAGDARLLDLGAGTGCAAISLLVECPEVTAVATDLSAGALAVARANALRLGVLPRLELRKGNWFDAVPAEARFDLIVSNPPYIESGAIAGLMTEVRDYDPRLALDGGADGLEAYRAILGGAPAHLKRGGWVALEIGAGQGPAVAALAAGAGLVDVAVKKDLSGLDRVVVGHHV